MPSICRQYKEERLPFVASITAQRKSLLRNTERGRADVLDSRSSSFKEACFAWDPLTVMRCRFEAKHFEKAKQDHK
jgi:hypothetical protein